MYSPSDLNVRLTNIRSLKKPTMPISDSKARLHVAKTFFRDKYGQVCGPNGDSTIMSKELSKEIDLSQSRLDLNTSITSPDYAVREILHNSFETVGIGSIPNRMSRQQKNIALNHDNSI